MKICTRTLPAGLCALLALTWLGVGVSRSQGDKEKNEVRPLKFAPKDPAINFRIGGQSKLTTLSDLAAVEKLVGKDEAKAVTSQVDLEKEKIVLVSWTTSGPPDGILKSESKGAGKDQRVIFYVQGPPGAQVRGQRARIGADFFAVPRSADVSFDPKERP